MKVFVIREYSGALLECGINHKLEFIKNNKFNLIRISYLIAPNNPSLLNSDKSEIVAIIEYEELNSK